jgi:hypothetical protein
LDQLAALVHKTVFESLQTASETKKKAFRAILLNFADGKGADAHRLDLFVQLVSRLTDLQIEILRVAKDPTALARSKKLISPGVPSYGDITLEQLIPSSTVELSRIAYRELKGLGLLNPKAEMMTNSAIPVHTSLLSLSDLGKDFLEWIERE